jgi:hypothetical protein
MNKPMHLTLNDVTQKKLLEAAHYCNLPPEKLCELFVMDGLELYGRDQDEFRGTLNGETD